MTSSFEKINYALRPGKHAARRMLCEIFACLGPFQPVKDYTYVGFGSVWFEDFILLHRALGIRQMISIERETRVRKRIEANKPFKNISVVYKKASVVLPKLHWKNRHFLWLDYEDPLDLEILRDVATVAGHAQSGTVLAVSVPCRRAQEVADAQDDPNGPSALERFSSTFGRARVSPTVTEIELEGWPFGKLTRQMVKLEVDTHLATRNARVTADNKLKFRPICELEYDDGTKMVTIVGLICRAADKELVAQCDFTRLDFLRARRRPIRIEVPKLTMREIRSLEQQLPRESGGILNRGSIPANEARAFERLYRYLPNFAVLES